MNPQLIVAGSLAVLAAAVHGLGGEVLVVRKLPAETLAASPFGGPQMTRAMIHVTWHLTTVAFFTVGAALILSGSVLDGDAARGLGLFAAARSPASRRSPWDWALPTRDLFGSCFAISAPWCSPEPRRWRGGEPSETSGRGRGKTRRTSSQPVTRKRCGSLRRPDPTRRNPQSLPQTPTSSTQMRIRPAPV